jgi:glucosamine--fructose-6-phosphate aminotransferase (isomerizing)
MENDFFTWQEIQSQPVAWQVALEQLITWQPTLADFYRDGGYESLIFTGCGSTYYLSLAAAASFTQISGKLGRALPASELWLSPGSSYPKMGRTLLVAVSRSGETSETLNACRSFLAQDRGDLLTLTCYPHSELASMGVLNLTFPASGEESFAQTRSFSTLYLATLALSALWAGRLDLLEQMGRLPQAAKHLMEIYTSLAIGLGEEGGLERLYFLGSGPRYGLAAELSLKMKEMSLSHSEPFHFMEFRHGPMAMVTERTLLVGLVSSTNKSTEIAVLQEMALRGAKLLSIGEAGVLAPFASQVDEAVYGPLFLPLGQILAYTRARNKGLNPDRPYGLQAVIRLDKDE